MVGEGWGVFKYEKAIFVASTKFSWQKGSMTTPYFYTTPTACLNTSYTQIVAHSLVEWEKPDESTSNGGSA